MNDKVCDMLLNRTCSTIMKNEQNNNKWYLNSINVVSLIIKIDVF